MFLLEILFDQSASYICLDVLSLDFRMFLQGLHITFRGFVESFVQVAMASLMFKCQFRFVLTQM